MTIGQRITKLRKVNNLSQKKLADKLSISRSALCKIEKDKATIELDLAMKICEEFNVSLNGFVYGIEDGNIESKSNYKFIQRFKLAFNIVTLLIMVFYIGVMGICFILDWIYDVDISVNLFEITFWLIVAYFPFPLIYLIQLIRRKI